jgi:hypothetical protein
VCYSSHGLPTRQRSTLCGACELATLHSSCVERITPCAHAGPPYPVARLPFWSSCARVRKRDEVMSVQMGTQTLHESRTRLDAAHCPRLCATDRRARECRDHSRWHSTTAATRRAMSVQSGDGSVR